MMVLSLLVVLTSASAPTTNVDEVPIPGCAVASTYSLLRLQGRDVSMRNVNETFESTLSRFDRFAVSIADVRRVLSEYDVSSEAIRTEPGGIARLPQPCILYFRPSRWPRGGAPKVGHFVTLVSAEPEAVLLDWNGQSVDTEIHVPLDQLAQHWDGEAIICSERRGTAWQVRGGVGLMVCGVAIFLGLRFRSRKSERHGDAERASVRGFSVLLLPGLLLFTGCERSDVEKQLDLTPTLAFEKPTVDVGVVSGTRMIEHAFAFRVWDREPVTITGFVTSCGCTTANNELIGRELTPGSEHAIEVHVRPDSEGVKATQLIRVTTVPETAAPLNVVLQYRREAPPQISERTILASVAPGVRPRAEFSITHRRLPGAKPVKIDRSRCSGSDFRVEAISWDSEMHTINPTRGVRVAVDTTRVKLCGSKTYSYGDHPGVLTIAFDDGSSQALESLVHVPHPFAPQQARIFCGLLRPGEHWSRTIRCKRSDDVSFEIESIKTVGAGLRASITADHRLEVSGLTPRIAGRFAQEILISFAPKTIPELRIPVSGIVR